MNHHIVHLKLVLDINYTSIKKCTWVTAFRGKAKALKIFLTSPAPSSMFLVFWGRTRLLLTPQGVCTALVSSLPVSLSATPLAWNLSEPQWKDSRNPLESWNAPYLAAGRQPELDSRWMHSAGRVTMSVRWALGDPPMPAAKLKQMHAFAPRAMALQQPMMGQAFQRRRFWHHHLFPSWGQSSQEREMTLINFEPKSQGQNWWKYLSSCI